MRVTESGSGWAPSNWMVLSLLSAGAALGETATPDVGKRLDDLDKAVKSAQMSGDNAWMLTSAALVLMMTGPGLALFYGGLVRRKNVLGTMMHSFILMATCIDIVGGCWLQLGLRGGIAFHGRPALSRF